MLRSVHPCRSTSALSFSSRFIFSGSSVFQQAAHHPLGSGRRTLRPVVAARLLQKARAFSAVMPVTGWLGFWPAGSFLRRYACHWRLVMAVFESRSFFLRRGHPHELDKVVRGDLDHIRRGEPGDGHGVGLVEMAGVGPAAEEANKRVEVFGEVALDQNKRVVCQRFPDEPGELSSDPVPKAVQPVGEGQAAEAVPGVGAGLGEDLETGRVLAEFGERHGWWGPFQIVTRAGKRDSPGRSHGEPGWSFHGVL